MHRSQGWRRVFFVAFASAVLACPVAASGQTGSEFARDLATDRPDFTESTRVVGRGVLQIETGALAEFDADGDAASETLSAPLALVRVGLGSRVELRLGADGTVANWLRAGEAPFQTSGVSDLDLGVKLALFARQHGGFEMAVIPMLSVPLGTANRTSGGYDPTVKLAWAQALPGGFDVSGNVNVGRQTDDGERFTQHTVSVSVGHDVGTSWGVFGEVYGLSRLSADGDAAWTLDAGVTRAIGRNAQIDVSTGRGLSGAAPDWSVGVGLSVRIAPNRPR